MLNLKEVKPGEELLRLDNVREYFPANKSILESHRKYIKAVDGISLTVASLNEDRFSVRIIPVTWNETALRRLRPPQRKIRRTGNPLSAGITNMFCWRTGRRRSRNTAGERNGWTFRRSWTDTA